MCGMVGSLGSMCLLQWLQEFVCAWLLNIVSSLPEVYRLTIQGRVICNGIIGTANIASVSFGTPASMSLRPVAESVTAKPICNVEHVYHTFVMLLCLVPDKSFH